MSDGAEPDHEQLVEEAKRHLEKTGSPRLLVFVQLLVTGAAGFLASYGLLTAGVTSMAVRYPLAVGASYLVFLGLLAVWLRWRRADDAMLVALAARPDGGRPGPAAAAPRPQRTRDTTSSSRGWWWWLDGGGGGGSDDGCAVVVVVILIIVAVVGAVVACGMVLAEAPALLGELLVDGAVLAAVAPRVGAAPPHWLGGVLRRTWLKVITVALIFSLVGLALSSMEPGARTMAEAFRMARVERR